MLFEGNNIVVIDLATAAFKRQFNWRLLYLTLMLFNGLFVFQFRLLNLVIEKICSGIEVHPNIAQLDYGSKTPSLKLVDEMVEFVRTLNELRLVCFYAQLHFNDDGLPVQNIDEDVSCGQVQFIPNVNDFNQFRLHGADPHQFIVKGHDLAFFRVAFTSEQISNFEGYQGG